ncbi:MAG: penicillin-binding protein 1C [Gammaproteobacteria bacterium]
MTLAAVCWVALALRGIPPTFAVPTVTVPSFATVQAQYAPSEGRVFDRFGALLHETRVDPQRRRAAWVPLDQISRVFQDTLVRIEDRRFYQHRGVDWRAMAGVAWRSVRLAAPRGASTITMQLVNLLAETGTPQGATASRSAIGKWRQMRAARTLERTWNKSQILEAYVNLASFRGEISGIGAASRGLLQKSADSLDATESLLLVSLLRSPNASAPDIAARGCRLIEAYQFTTQCAAFDHLTHQALRTPPHLAPRVALAPHVARLVLRPDLREVTTSIDLAIQQTALQALRQHLTALRGHHVYDGSALVLDNRTGEVLAYVGNHGVDASARYVDGVRAARQAGSTLKPFLYGLALERKLLTAASLLDDSPVNLQTPSGLYVPENYDRAFKGLVSLRTALASSLNIPAVRTLMLIGPDAFIARLHQLGFRGIRHDADHYGYALALGSVEVSLWDLVNAYRNLANGGDSVCPATLAKAGAKPCDAISALDPATSFILSDILSDRGSRGLTFGLESPLTTPFWSAVKTGTSKHMRDNWCVGYSTRYTVGVWVGNFDGSPMHDVSGVTGSAPVWLEIMRALHARAPSPAANHWPGPPPGVEQAPVRFVASREAERSEWFVAGTATTRIEPAPPGAQRPRIVYPGRDSILVLDPDIPLANQRVFFEMRPKHPASVWQLDGQRLGNGAAWPWTPVPGVHTLSLLSSDTELDRLRFQVRGAWRSSE